MSWTLRRRVTALLAGCLVFVLVSSGLGWLAFSQLLEARRDLIERVDPAARAARDVFNAFLNQETGLRGYVLTARPDFLDPYEQGRADAALAGPRLSSLVSELPGVREAASELLDRGADWQAGVATPAIDAVEAGDPDAAERQLEAGKSEFDGFREAYGLLDAELAMTREAASASLDQATGRLVAVLLLTVAALGALGVVVWLALRRWVLVPIDAIGGETRLVAAGDLGYRIRATGPPELAQLAGDAEAMRRRIVAELTEVEATRSQLDAQARELARSNAELEQFAYVASHDLQEPLRKVASFCELLRRRYHGELDERADQYIDFAVDGAKRMQVLINDLLAFSRVGRVTDGMAEVDLDEVVASALSHLQLVIEESGAEVRVGPLPTLIGERSLLVLLFQNLVENAVKFRGEQIPVIEIEAAPQAVPSAGPPAAPSAGSAVDHPHDGEPDAPGDEQGWSFSVRDNGIGIPPEYRDKVFVIFQRLHSRESYPGTGIGLAMCRKIVEYHGGRMWIEDAGADRPGTTFRWTLAAVGEDQAVTDELTGAPA